MSRLVKTSKGQVIDFDSLRKKHQNDTVISSGSGDSMLNVRGDEIGRGGKIIRTAEELAAANNLVHSDATPVKTAPSKLDSVVNSSAPSDAAQKKLAELYQAQITEMNDASSFESLDDEINAFESEVPVVPEKTIEELEAEKLAEKESTASEKDDIKKNNNTTTVNKRRNSKD